MAFRDIQQLIRNVIGITPESIGEATFERAVRERMRIQDCNNIYSYFSLLTTSPQEQQYLINEVTVPETWFFRDDEPFRLLSDYISKVLSPAPEKKIKILSVPCSSGEEPYSIAMTIFQVGLTRGEFSIDAADVSTKVLEQAKRGVYGRNSFRNQTTDFRSQYFSRNAMGMYQIDGAVKGVVDFHHQNILSPDFMSGLGPYDIIFCRNLLIYFDVDVRAQVFNKLYELLLPDGLLFLGHAETGRVDETKFRSLRHPGAFAYQKVAKISSSSLVGHGRYAVPGKEQMYISREGASRTQKKTYSSNYRESQPEEYSVEDELSRIKRLADEGSINKAHEACNEYIAKHPDSSEGYCLCGVIQAANNQDDRAMEYFKKSLYLDPDNYHALAHIAAICEKKGDHRAAENYRARISRIENK